MHTNQDTGAKVAEAIRKADRTKLWVAEHAGMTAGTLRKKIRSGGDSFTIGEIFDIASTLGIDPRSLLPDSFTE